MANEPKLTDQRPQERRRARNSLRLLIGGLVLGAAGFALVLWIIAMIVDQHYSALIYVLVAVIGGAVGMGILPLLSAAHHDGQDAGIVEQRRPGRADAPIEGAEAIDEGRATRSGEHI